MKEEQISDRQEIRTSLTYCLPSGIKDFEWEVIINNVQSLIKQTLAKQKEEMVEKIDKLQVYYLPSKNGREEVVILQDIINLINNKAE